MPLSGGKGTSLAMNSIFMIIDTLAVVEKAKDVKTVEQLRELSASGKPKGPIEKRVQYEPLTDHLP